MVSPRHRVAPVFAVVFLVLIWISLLASYPREIFRPDPESAFLVSAPPLCANLILVLILTLEWKESTLLRSRRKSTRPELEVIPVERWKPEGLKRRRKRQRVIVVRRRHVHRVGRSSFVHVKRRALGLPERPPLGLNRRRPRGWHRKLAW